MELAERKGFQYRVCRVLLWVCIFALLPGCSGTVLPALRVGNGTEPEELDPHIIKGIPEHRIVSTLFEGLVDVDPSDLHAIPATAETWDISPDGKEYTFHLRTTACWSNGDPVTAHDFVYAWQRILSPGLGSEYAYMLYCLKNAKAYNEGTLKDFGAVGATAIDAQTLHVTLENPTPYFLSMQVHFTWYPVHRPTIERFGSMDTRNTKWTRPGNLVGNGAFVLKRWIPNNLIEVVKNDRYWNAAQVRLPRILFYPTDNLLTEERSFRTGQLDLTENVPMTKVPVYRREHPELICIDPYLGTYFYRFNTSVPPLNDVRVRRALALALDRTALTRDVLTGGQIPAGEFTPPNTAGYSALTSISYDVPEAQKLLAEAGYPDGTGFPAIEILYNTSESHKLIAEAIQQMWKKTLHIEVRLVNQDWKVYLASQKNMDFQIARASWIGDYVDPINFLECFVTGGGNNRTGWSSPEFDAQINTARRCNDPQQRVKALQEAERILLDAAPILPIYHYTRVYLKSPRILNWHANLLGYIPFKDLALKENMP